jgi:hypothetical protein
MPDEPVDTTTAFEGDRREESLVRGHEMIEASGVTVADLFSVLNNRRRRDVIRCLRREETEMALRDICEVIAAWENDTTRADVDYKERKRVYTSLYQNHLPKMVDAGIVEHDEETSTVRLTDAVRDLTIEFVSARSHRPPWRGVAVGAGLVAVGTVLVLFAPVDPVSPIVVLVVVTALVLGAVTIRGV